MSLRSSLDINGSNRGQNPPTLAVGPLKRSHTRSAARFYSPLILTILARTAISPSQLFGVRAAGVGLIPSGGAPPTAQPDIAMPQRFESKIFSPEANKVMHEAFEAAWLKATLIDGNREADPPTIGERNHRSGERRRSRSRSDRLRRARDVGGGQEHGTIAPTACGTHHRSKEKPPRS
jgi:hypothetical protein